MLYICNLNKNKMETSTVKMSFKDFEELLQFKEEDFSENIPRNILKNAMIDF